MCMTKSELEKKVAEYTKDQMMDTLYDFCLQKNASKENAFHFFDFFTQNNV